MDALKPLAYMRILFLIATSRTDYDTPRDLYARCAHVHDTRLSPITIEGWLQNQIAQRFAASTRQFEFFSQLPKL